MRDYGRKGKWRQFAESGPVLAALFAIVGIFAWNVFNFGAKMLETGKNRRLAEEKTESLREEKAKLEGNIARLDTESGVEESIREKFGWGREGEGLIVIIDEERSESEVFEKEGGFWNFVKNLFK